MNKLLTAAFQFGDIEPPPGIEAYGDQTAGLILFLNNILKIALFAGGVFTIINVILSGFDYIGQGHNPDALKKALHRIWISLLGLVVIGSSLAIAALVGLIFFNAATAIINPILPGAE